jgi:hypothetical protein
MSESIVFESILIDADFTPGDMKRCWWTLRFENGAIIRVPDEEIDKRGPIWWKGQRYRVKTLVGKTFVYKNRYVAQLMV